MTPTDSETKTRIMREFYRLRASGQPVPPEAYARFVAVTNEGFASGPEVGPVGLRARMVSYQRPGEG